MEQAKIVAKLAQEVEALSKMAQQGAAKADEMIGLTQALPGQGSIADEMRLSVRASFRAAAAALDALQTIVKRLE